MYRIRPRWRYLETYGNVTDTPTRSGTGPDHPVQLLFALALYCRPSGWGVAPEGVPPGYAGVIQYDAAVLCSGGGWWTLVPAHRKPQALLQET